MKIDWKKLKKLGKQRIKIPKTKIRTIKLKEPSKIISIMEQESSFLK